MCARCEVMLLINVLSRFNSGGRKVCGGGKFLCFILLLYIDLDKVLCVIEEEEGCVIMLIVSGKSKLVAIFKYFVILKCEKTQTKVVLFLLGFR